MEVETTSMSVVAGRMKCVTDEAWRPLGAEGRQEFEGLADGIPGWLAESFWTWMRDRFSEAASARVAGSSLRFNKGLLRQAERVCRFSTGFTGYALADGMASLRTALTRGGLELRVADFLLASRGRYADAQALDQMFAEGGSAWKVGVRAGQPGLVHRVEEGVQVAAESVMSTAGHAGARLAEAWSAAYGIDPDPSRAYSLAVKSVEDAAVAVVEPANRSATLGTVIHVLRNGQFQFDLPREMGEVTSRDVLLSMMRLLWNGQADRHGGHADATVEVEPRHAEAAVLLAVPLVQLFASGAVRKVESPLGA